MPGAFTLADLLAALDLAPGTGDAFVGRGPSQGGRRVFGGLIVAQALVAMSRTVAPAPGQGGGPRPIHALHGLFLRPGDPDEPFDHAVVRLRDGGSFTARSCTASQHGRPVFVATASFQTAEAAAFDHQTAMPDAPAPDDAPGSAALPPGARAYLARNAAVDVRPVAAEPSGGGADPGHPRRRSLWMRAAGPLPDDPALHAAVLAYMSDLTLLDTALLAHGRSVFDPAVQAASLDHALWFHRPVRADGWLLFAEHSPSAANGRGFARGTVYDASGALVASVAQEGLIRLRD